MQSPDLKDSYTGILKKIMLGHKLNVLPSQLATFIIHQHTYPGKKPLAKQVLGWFRNSTAIHSCNFPGLWEVLIGCICTAAMYMHHSFHGSSGSFAFPRSCGYRVWNKLAQI